MNKKVSKLLALAMAFVLVLSMAGVAFAETFYTASGYAYATDAVNVRSGPDSSYSVLGYFSKGDQVTITGTVSTGWTQVRLPGGVLGYVKSSYLTSSYPSGSYYPTPVPSGTTFRVTTSALNIRTGPGTGYSVVGVLKKGDQVTRIGQNGKWFKIATSNGSEAWVSSKYLSSTDGSYVYVEDTASTTMYATTGVNIRSGPGTKYSIVGGLNRGDRVTKIGKSGNWTKISWGSGSAYVYSQYLQGSAAVSGGYQPSSSSYTRYATGLLNVRSGPDTSYGILGTIGQGQSVTCVGTSGNWTKIVWGGNYGYVYTAYLSSTYYGNVCPGGSGWYGPYYGNNVLWGSDQVYLQRSADLYSTNNSSLVNYVRTLSQGTRVTLVSMESNGWAKVMYGGTVYYVASGALAYVN
ncbi:MAG: SH3 domain-containing protein [Candidatus Pelethousia sp.]|nr:SH3 domain-containing protein [Candidatus Pelethousia sp.]